MKKFLEAPTRGRHTPEPTLRNKEVEGRDIETKQGSRLTSRTGKGLAMGGYLLRVVYPSPTPEPDSE